MQQYTIITLIPMAQCVQQAQSSVQFTRDHKSLAYDIVDGALRPHKSRVNDHKLWPPATESASGNRTPNLFCTITFLYIVVNAQYFQFVRWKTVCGGRNVVSSLHILPWHGYIHFRAYFVCFQNRVASSFGVKINSVSWALAQPKSLPNHPAWRQSKALATKYEVSRSANISASS